MHALLYSVPPTLQQATTGPGLCQRVLDTHGQVCVSLVGSLLLSPESWCPEVCVCALQESVSPVLHKFWWLYGGVSGDFLQKCYTIPPIQEFSYGSHTPYAAKILICQCPLPCLVIRMF